MRHFILAVVLSLSPQFDAAYAQGGVPPIAVVGKWTATDRLPDGTTLVANVVLSQNMKFAGSVSIAGKPLWEYSGTWSVSGNTLTWRYETSSRPLPESAKVDTDEIVSYDDSKLVLLSRLSGKRHEYLRER